MIMILSACLVVALVANLVAINRISEKIDQVNDLIVDLDMLYVRVSKYLMIIINFNPYLLASGDFLPV